MVKKIGMKMYRNNQFDLGPSSTCVAFTPTASDFGTGNLMLLTDALWLSGHESFNVNETPVEEFLLQAKEALGILCEKQFLRKHPDADQTALTLDGSRFYTDAFDISIAVATYLNTPEDMGDEEEVSE